MTGHVEGGFSLRKKPRSCHVFPLQQLENCWSAQLRCFTALRATEESEILGDGRVQRSYTQAVTSIPSLTAESLSPSARSLK